jgi:hypothetical protein
VEEINFKTDSSGLRAALDTVKIVKPGDSGAEGTAAYLFVVAKKVHKNQDGTPGPNDGKDVCYVYSRDALHATRAEFPIYGVTGEGAWTYPAEHIDSFTFGRGELTFEIRNDHENSNFNVKWGYGKGATVEKSVSSPRRLSTIDKRVNDASEPRTYFTAYLREAINKGKAFLDSQQNAKDEHKIIYLYDGAAGPKVDGTLCTTDGYQRFYFSSDAFKGNALQIHVDHVGYIEQFLSQCGSEVLIRTGSEMTFATDKDHVRVLGWAKHTKAPRNFDPLPRQWDKVSLLIKDKDRLIEQLGWIKKELSKGYDKIKLEYNHNLKEIRLHVKTGGKLTTLPIEVDVVKYELPDTYMIETLDGLVPGFSNDLSVIWLEAIFKDMKATVPEFGMFLMEDHGGPKGGMGFRTVDEFWLNAEGTTVGGKGATPDQIPGVHSCRVTRFMPSKL